MSNEISNTDSVIDSRDVIARIEELTDLGTHYDGGEDPLFNIRLLDGDERHEYEALTKLAEQAEGYAPDWNFGATLIHDDYFKTYAEELAEEIGAIDPEAGWPLNRIDWEAAADDLKIDYTAVDFDGETYWIR